MIAVVLLATLVAAFFAVLGGLKVAAVPAMAERARHVGFTAAAYRRIGLLELAGAAGIVVGAAVPWVGVAAAAGLLALLAGALAAHLRTGDRGRNLAPAAVAALAVAGYLALQLGRLAVT